MTQERADALVQLRADDVLELARVRIGRFLLDGKRVCQQPLRQAPPPDDIARPIFASRSERYFVVAHLQQSHVSQPRD